MLREENFLTSLQIKENQSILNALEKLEINKKRFLLVIDEQEKVLGSLVDGDIRRAFLQGAQLKSCISGYENKRFKFLNQDATFDEICIKFKDEKIDYLPILDSSSKLVNVITKKQFHIMLLENIKLNLKDDFTKYDQIKLEHEIYNRPWGFYKSTVLTSHAQGKIITVFPLQELSLQEHKKREEHWVIIKGTGKVILAESEIDIYPGKYIYIPKGCKHKAINTSEKDNLIFTEVQLGNYFGEDDIIRYEDKYNRI